MLRNIGCTGSLEKFLRRINHRKVFKKSTPMARIKIVPYTRLL